jgi:hypothetical protein
VKFADLRKVTRKGLVRVYEWPIARSTVLLFQAAKRPERWLFVLGCYNSGTTLLQDLIGLHPEVSTLPREGVRFTRLLARPEDYGWTRMWAQCVDKIQLPPIREPERAERIILEWSPFYRTGARVFLEKSVSNIPRMEWLDRNFPNAYFVGIIRHPYAVSEGIRRKARPRLQPARIYGERYPIELTARQWLVANELLHSNAQKVERFHMLRYEDLVADPVIELGRIFRYIGVRETELSFSKGVLTIGGRLREIRNMNGESIVRLSQEDVTKINEAIGIAKIREMGYEPL